MPIKVAVLGYGFSAKVFHLPFITSVPLLQVITILERSSDTCLQEFPDVHVAKSIDDVLSNQEIQLVIITTVNHTHYAFAKRALEAGKHVVVEKPFTEDSVQAQELCDLAAHKNVVLSVYHNRRWDGDFLTARKLIDDGIIGRPVFWESYFNRFQPALSGNWREQVGQGSGVLYDLGSHLIDQVVCAFGKPASLTAFTWNERQTEPKSVDDSFMVTLQYPNLGLSALCRASCLDATDPPSRLTVRGTQGTYVKHGMDPQESQLMGTPSKKPGSHPETFGREDSKFHGTVFNASASSTVPTISGQWVRFYENVAKAIESGDRSLLEVKSEEALLVIRLLELCRVSAKEGKTVYVD